MKYLSEVSAMKTAGSHMIISIPKAYRNMLELDEVEGLTFKVFMDNKDRLVLEPSGEKTSKK